MKTFEELWRELECTLHVSDSDRRLVRKGFVDGMAAFLRWQVEMNESGLSDSEKYREAGAFARQIHDELARNVLNDIKESN